ncbi:putative receptor-like protein 12-like [Capsicum annuum]|nr:putative receptor-like protein 12-like [Capsicum annuum]
MSSAGEEADWLRSMLIDISLWGKPIPPLTIYCDNKTSIFRASSDCYNGKSRQVRLKHNHVRILLEDGIISLQYVKSKLNLADSLSKGLGKELVVIDSRDSFHSLDEKRREVLKIGTVHPCGRVPGAEDKMLICLCHLGRKNKVLPDGSILYVGGTVARIVVKAGITYHDFVNAVFDRLCVDPSDKILHFTVKFDKSELIRLRDQEGVNALLQFNDDFAHIYASGFEEEPYSRLPSGGAKKVECIVESDRISDGDPPEMYVYPDPEFSDFDKHRAQICVAVDKICAYYDRADGMPRHYALIRKVLYPEFKIKFRMLVPRPEDQREANWVSGCLPVICGTFKRGITTQTSDLFAFSHQVQCLKGKGGQYIVHPRKGETWALFKDRDTHQSSSPEKQREYKYKVVEILSDYVKNVGVKPNELYMFSHRIPSFKMTGTEREDVPAGSFELDPYALPLNPDDIWCPGKGKEDMQ